MSTVALHEAGARVAEELDELEMCGMSILSIWRFIIVVASQDMPGGI